jgi:CRISPR-associated protein Cas5t
MITKWLRIQARFASFRNFQAGVYRASAPVIPPSTAYGLLMNIAGIDVRDYGDAVTTQIQQDIPEIEVAIGLVTPVSIETGMPQFPELATLYQQLHSYPVGKSGDTPDKPLKARAKGAKYWIVPVRRELIVGFDGIIGLRSEDSVLFQQIDDGLVGRHSKPRYGLPFLGDNNYLIDRIEWLEEPPGETSWYIPIKMEHGPKRGSCRLTIGIDRSDNSRTTSKLFAPNDVLSSEPPSDAWTWTPRMKVA